MICVKCNKNLISNKHFKLCTFCNESRLNEKKRKPSSNTISRKGIRTTTQRVNIHNSQKESFRKAIKAQRNPLCQGCHSTTRLTFSHTIPISLRKDLEFDSDNVQLECIVCHIKWEHGSLDVKKQLFNYQQKVDYIKKVDPHYHERKFKEI